MTLILTLATPFYVLQVSDRLVTRDGREFDAMSNKTVIFEASNAIVSISYSGRAYIGDVPTDEWITNELSGRQRSTQRSGMAFSSGPMYRTDLGKAMLGLASKLTMATTARRAKRDQIITIGGWQWNRRGIARPLIGVIEADVNAPFSVEWIPRHWEFITAPREPSASLRRGFRLAWAPDGYLSKGEMERLVQMIGGCMRDAERCEKLLVTAVRMVSARSNLVGAHCMSVLMPPPSARFLRGRYVPVQPGQALVTGGDSSVTVPAAFSPAIVTPMSVYRPAVIVGGFTANTGTFEISLEAPPTAPHSGIRAAFSSQRRPRRP